MIHSEFILFEIINFYHTITNKDSISLKNLEKSFYKLLEFASDIKKTRHFNFKQELHSFLEDYPNYISIDDCKLTINDDLDELYDLIIDNCENVSEIDFDLKDIVIDPEISMLLNIDIPLNDTDEIFNLNGHILKLFIKCAEEEFYCHKNPNTIKLLKKYITYLENDVKNSEESFITKIKLCINYLNSIYLQNKNKNFFSRSAWYIILFSYNPNEFKTLLYTYLEDLVYIIGQNSIDEDLTEEHSEYIELEDEEINELYDNSQNDELNINGLIYNKYDYEMPIFFTYFIIFLNNFLEKFPYTNAREALIIKKYELLSLPLLANIQDYYLEHETINELTLPKIPKEWYNSSAFDMFIETALECAYNINVENEILLKKPHLMADAITKAIFIKCFLSLSNNEPIKEEIISTITDPEFYKKTNYQIASNLIDNIIFAEYPKLKL